MHPAHPFLKGEPGLPFFRSEGTMWYSLSEKKPTDLTNCQLPSFRSGKGPRGHSQEDAFPWAHFQNMKRRPGCLIHSCLSHAYGYSNLQPRPTSLPWLPVSPTRRAWPETVLGFPKGDSSFGNWVGSGVNAARLWICPVGTGLSGGHFSQYDSSNVRFPVTLLSHADSLSSIPSHKGGCLESRQT